MLSSAESADELSIADLQRHIRQMYYEKDVARGTDGTFMWLMEEIGELASALRGDDRENLAEEFADVIAWLATIANVAEIDLNAALQAKYGRGCPGCSRLVVNAPIQRSPRPHSRLHVQIAFSCRCIVLDSVVAVSHLPVGHCR